jgi:uncharacterized protein YbjT (DUF2867 family)
MNTVFITGGTGYMGRRLIRMLIKEGFEVTALVRPSSIHKLPPECAYVSGNPFDPSTFVASIPSGCTFVQLLGVSHPSPKKKELFRSIDLVSVKASVTAARQAGVGHFVYVSVAQVPTKIMEAFQAVRAEGEAAISEAGLKATVIRPWYVVGPGHYWPLLFLPLFKLLEWIPSTSAKAKALRLVSLRQMLNTLVFAVKHPPEGQERVIEIQDIRSRNYARMPAENILLHA